MKKKIYLFSKIVLLTTLISLIFSCEKDLYDDVIQQNQNKQINIKQISLEKFNLRMRQMKNKPDIERFMVSSKNSFLQNRTESTSGFEIVTDDIKEITQGDYTSYTMYVKTSDTTNNIYNITIEEVDGYTTFFITKYIPDTNWLENKDQPFEGEIITFREPNTNSDGTVSLQEYMELIGDDLYAAGGGGGNSTSGFGNNLGPSTIYPSDCNGEVHTTVVVEALMCSDNEHWPWTPGICIADRKARISTRTYYECIPNIGGNPYGNGNTSGSGDTSGGNTLGGGGSGTGTGSGGTSTGAVTGSITTIVDPTEEEKKTPCEELIENDSISDFNTKMAELKIKSGTQNFESAHAIYQNAGAGLIIGDEFTGQSNANGEGREVYLSLNSSITTNAINCVGFIHCHLDNGTTFKVFSLDDIIALALITESSTRPVSEFTIYLTTNSGTLALKVNNKILLNSKIDMLNITYNDQEREFKTKVKMGQTYAEQKLGLIKFLNNMPLIGNPGIDVYEKVGSTWNKLNLSANGNSIISTPCN
ncbi:hypothetical protein [Flavobacterium channae]|uniref:hypothetical protein n=1 Tax=Flavobacterium channae TaxID=2897181 RepID=UPI001E610EFA|nr:hypothetical protein [Flavobacterium channae]UGS24285.1 hypothetical protein LOS89_03190 [Flavobacterium channae]